MKSLQRKIDCQLTAKTPHGVIQYSYKCKFIDVGEVLSFLDKKKFDALCEIGCPNYNNKWSCPPYAPDFKTFTQNYKYIDIVMLLVEMREFSYIKQDFLKIKAANSVLKSRIDKALRLSINKEEFYISTGSCRLCKPCKRKNGENCAHPTERTFSFEALGIDVSSLTKELFKKELLWYKDKILPQYTCVVAGLLTNNNLPNDKVIGCLIKLT